MFQVLIVYLADSAAEEIYWHTFDWGTLVYLGPSHLVEGMKAVMTEEEDIFRIIQIRPVTSGEH